MCGIILIWQKCVTSDLLYEDEACTLFQNVFQNQFYCLKYSQKYCTEYSWLNKRCLRITHKMAALHLDNRHEFAEHCGLQWHTVTSPYICLCPNAASFVTDNLWHTKQCTSRYNGKLIINALSCRSFVCRLLKSRNVDHFCHMGPHISRRTYNMLCAVFAVGRPLLDKECVTVQIVSNWFANKRKDLRKGLKEG